MNVLRRFWRLILRRPLPPTVKRNGGNLVVQSATDAHFVRREGVRLVSVTDVGVRVDYTDGTVFEINLTPDISRGFRDEMVVAMTWTIWRWPYRIVLATLAILCLQLVMPKADGTTSPMASMGDALAATGGAAPNQADIEAEMLKSLASIGSASSDANMGTPPQFTRGPSGKMEFRPNVKMPALADTTLNCN